MKKRTVVIAASLLIVLSSIVSSCGTGKKGCKAMRHHRSDVKRGLAS